MPYRIGHGYDIHRSRRGSSPRAWRVRFDTDYGLDGHSDADCVTHAICDALSALPACPISAISSRPRTPRTRTSVPSPAPTGRSRTPQRGWAPVNIDANRYRGEAADSVASRRNETRPRQFHRSLGRRRRPESHHNEGVGDLGRSLAIAAHAVALIGKS